MVKINLFTVVQHSGCGYGGDYTFRRGLEVRNVDNAKDRNAVQKAGGLLFDTWGKADNYCDEEMYRDVPEGAFVLVPRAPGTFAAAEVDGLRVYVPPRETPEQVAARIGMTFPKPEVKKSITVVGRDHPQDGSKIAGESS